MGYAGSRAACRANDLGRDPGGPAVVGRRALMGCSAKGTRLVASVWSRRNGVAVERLRRCCDTNGERTTYGGSLGKLASPRATGSAQESADGRLALAQGERSRGRLGRSRRREIRRPLGRVALSARTPMELGCALRFGLAGTGGRGFPSARADGGTWEASRGHESVVLGNVPGVVEVRSEGGACVMAVDRDGECSRCPTVVGGRSPRSCLRATIGARRRAGRRRVDRRLLAGHRRGAGLALADGPAGAAPDRRLGRCANREPTPRAALPR